MLNTTKTSDESKLQASLIKSWHFAPNRGVNSAGSDPDAGLLVLSSSHQIILMNAQARKLMALFGQAYELRPCISPESMPRIITEFCEKVFTELRSRPNHHNWSEVDLRQICHMVRPALLLRGFGMPPAQGQELRMVLVLQPCSPLDEFGYLGRTQRV